MTYRTALACAAAVAVLTACAVPPSEDGEGPGGSTATNQTGVDERITVTASREEGGEKDDGVMSAPEPMPVQELAVAAPRMRVMGGARFGCPDDGADAASDGAATHAR